MLTHLVTIVLLFGGAYWISSLMFSLDAGLRILLAPVLTNRIAASSEHLRSLSSFALKCTFVLLACATIVLASEAANVSLGMLCLFFIAKLVSVLDGMFGAHLIYALEEEHGIEIATSSAALNILSRGSTAIAPALSLVIIRSTTLAALVAVAAFTIQVTIMFLSRRLFFGAPANRPMPSARRAPRGDRADTLLSNPFTRWGLLFALLGNFSLAGVTLLLMRYLQTEERQFMNEISALYVSFFATQLIVLIYGNRAVPATSIRASSLWLFAVGVLTIGVATSSASLRLTICLILGSAYGILLSSIAKTLLPAIGKTLYVGYSAWALPIGRGASMAATLLVGAAMSYKLSTSFLLAICGASALAAAMVLYLVAPPSRSLQQA